MTAQDRLRALLDPGTTAVLTMEVQQGVVGDEALFPALVDQVEAVDLIGFTLVSATEPGRSGPGWCTTPWSPGPTEPAPR